MQARLQQTLSESCCTRALSTPSLVTPEIDVPHPLLSMPPTRSVYSHITSHGTTDHGTALHRGSAT